jgi:hypothetical protein
MIRLGSLAGYPFEGPRLLAGWTPPAGAAVYAILYKPDPDTKPERYAVIFVGHGDDLAAERFPFGHPRADCWVRRAGSKWRVYIATYQIPGGGRGHREQITRELAAIYQPQCNADRYGQSWKQEWIGEYTAPTTGPLARRGPGEGDGGARRGPGVQGRGSGPDEGT